MKTFSTLILFVSFSFSAIAQSAETADFEPQNLPLNYNGTADAYSWLSKDGLRIYFTRDHSEDEIWMAERKSLTEEFRNPEVINIKGIEGSHEVFSCWLTEDEKTVFFITRRTADGFSTSLFKATYDETSKQFIDPVKINLTGGTISETSDIFISGPSLTADLKQLFVYYNDEHSDEQIACFTSTDGINYSFKLFVNDGKNYCPGSLADNGLSFYLSIRDKSNLLVKLSRPNLDADFGNPEYFKIDPNINANKSYYQPSVNTELGIISMTFGLGTWESNDLAIIKIPTERTVYQEKIDLVVGETDSAASVEITEYSEIPLEENQVMEELLEEVATVDTAQKVEIVWNFEDNTIVSDSFTTLWPSHCRFGYEDSKVVFLGESPSEDTLSFDTDGEFIIPVSNHTTSYFNAMPNPASSSFRIVYDIKTNKSERPIFEMTNLNGQIVKRFELESTSGNFEIDINDLAEGLYLYKIISSDFVSPVKKLVVKR